MAVATAEAAAMLVDTGVVMSAAAMAVDTVILPAPTTALVISVRVASAETAGLRASASSVVGRVSTATHSATGMTGIALRTSAGLAGAAGEAAGAVGEAGSDRCSGRFFWETFSRARSGPIPTAIRSGRTAPSSPTTTGPMRHITATAVRQTFTVTSRIKN